MCVLLFNASNGFSSWVKEMDRLIWKGMSNIYYCQTFTITSDVIKTLIFSVRKFEETH